MKPFVSIVIPIFNRADTIARTIESCLEQTYQHFEIVLVDDCSTDDLASALLPFEGDDRIRLVRHERNRRAAAARNTGVREAKGDLIAFMDSDDAWYPQKLEKQLAFVQSRNVERFLCGTLNEMRSDTTVTKIRPKRQCSRDVRIGDYLFVDKVQKRLPLVADHGHPLVGGCFAQTSSYLLPRWLALETPFPETLKQYEDYAFLIELDEKGTEFFVVEEPLTIYHNDERAGRISASDDVARGWTFLDMMGDALSADARQAFEATHFGHLYAKESMTKVIRITASAFARGLISPRSVLGILSRSVMDLSTQKKCRDYVTTLSWQLRCLMR
jgi:glycosyltransferase involved in cell wall biosynthesis